jgi:hypothetical protein
VGSVSSVVNNKPLISIKNRPVKGLSSAAFFPIILNMPFKKFNFEIVEGTTEGITYKGARKRRQTVLIRVGKRHVSRQALLLGLFLAFLQLVDAVFTYIGLSNQGIQLQGDSLAARVMNGYGLFPALLVSKLAALILIAIITWVAHRRRWIRPFILMLCAAYLTMAVVPWMYILKSSNSPNYLTTTKPADSVKTSDK